MVDLNGQIINFIPTAIILKIHLKHQIEIWGGGGTEKGNIQNINAKITSIFKSFFCTEQYRVLGKNSLKVLKHLSLLSNFSDCLHQNISCHSLPLSL
jgi:hypothetical protein